jgi:putative ABC transport system ATP-binding protein
MIKSSSKKGRSQIPVLRLEKISKSYKTGSNVFYALKDISLTINKGEFISITGASGSGKSTLMHLVGLLDTPTSGKIFLENHDISSLKENQLARLRNQKIGFVFQQFNLLAKTSAVENVALPLLYSDIAKKNHQNLAISMLSKVGLSDKLKNTPAQLSGGQQQRVAIARALINSPKIILADEPTGNLDSKSGTEVLKILKRLHSEGNTIVMVTHDMNLAKIAQRMIVLKDGQILT